MYVSEGAYLRRNKGAGEYPTSLQTARVRLTAARPSATNWPLVTAR